MNGSRIALHNLPPGGGLQDAAKAIKGGEVYDFPGEYAQRFDGIDPGGNNVNVLPFQVLRRTR